MAAAAMVENWVFGTLFALENACRTPNFRPWRPPPSNGRLGLSRFNDAALSNSVLGNVSTPPIRGGGTMAAVVHSFPISDAMVHVKSHARREVYIRIVLRMLTWNQNCSTSSFCRL